MASSREIPLWATTARETLASHLLVSKVMTIRSHSLRRIPPQRRRAEHLGDGNRSRPTRFRRFAAGSLAGLVVVSAAACSNDEETLDSTVASTLATTTSIAATTTTTPPLPSFGDLASPCGPATDDGVPVIADGQNPAATLKLGVANDSALPKSLDTGSDTVDTARAFAAWCNDQGGIRGLPIEIVDLDAKVSGVPLAMEQACAEIFALVGGGWTLDDQMYPRFHECGLVSFPAFTVSAAASNSNGRAQALPTPIDVESTMWLEWIEETYSDAVDTVAIVHADLATVSNLAERQVAAMQIVGGFGDPMAVAYDPSGSAEWSEIVEQLVSNEIEAVSFIGSAAHLVDLYSAMDAAAYRSAVVFGEANLLSDTVLDSVPAESLANLRIRSIHDPTADIAADSAAASLNDMLTSVDPAMRASGLGILTTSSLLLFATAANSCLDADGNVLERECTLAQALKFSAWTAGGLHAPANPAESRPAPCVLVIGVEGATWWRVHPILGSSDDTSNGWHCDDDRIATIEGDFGDITLGVDSTRLN